MISKLTGRVLYACSEKARRRDPRLYSYLAIPCEATKQVSRMVAGSGVSERGLVSRVKQACLTIVTVLPLDTCHFASWTAVVASAGLKRQAGCANIGFCLPFLQSAAFLCRVALAHVAMTAPIATLFLSTGCTPAGTAHSCAATWRTATARGRSASLRTGEANAPPQRNWFGKPHID